MRPKSAPRSVPKSAHRVSPKIGTPWRAKSPESHLAAHRQYLGWDTICGVLSGVLSGRVGFQVCEMCLINLKKTFDSCVNESNIVKHLRSPAALHVLMLSFIVDPVGSEQTVHKSWICPTISLDGPCASWSGKQVGSWNSSVTARTARRSLSCCFATVPLTTRATHRADPAARRGRWSAHQKQKTAKLKKLIRISMVQMNHFGYLRFG